MGLVDYLLMAGIALALGWAVRVCLRNHKNGKTCGGDCAHCSQNCGK